MKLKLNILTVVLLAVTRLTAYAQSIYPVWLITCLADGKKNQDTLYFVGGTPFLFVYDDNNENILNI
ncbi:MAG: hypothetical protein LBH32_02205 [Dysgonamonadaceae bacterium]|jgi:hypothetical protein|nr:hypothetical protein [Dysgonamonadaceae bacterium]